MLPGSLPLIRLSLRTAAVLVLLVLHLASPTPVAGNCFITGLPERTGQPPAPLPLRIGVDRDDLLVTVQWPDSPDSPNATFVLSTPGGLEAGAWPAETAPGEETEQRLPGALAGVATAGFQYLLELREPDRVLGRRNLRVTVNCGREPCEYGLVPGLEAGPIVVSEELWNALDEARADLSPDLLATARDQHPEVAGEIPGFAWQWLQAEPEPGSGCHCRWLVAEKTTQGLYIGPRSGQPPRHRFGKNLEGAAFLTGIQAKQGTIAVQRNETEGRSLIGLHLLCTRYHGANPASYPTVWPSLPQLKIWEPVVSSCPAPCTPVIKHLADVGGCAQAGATSRDDQRVQAWAEVDAKVTLNGRSRITGAAQLDVDVTRNELVRDIEYLFKHSTATLEAESAIARLSAGGYLSVTAQPPANGTWSYGFATASLEYFMYLHAPEICGIAKGVAGLYEPLQGTQDGGVALERWEDP